MANNKNNELMAEFISLHDQFIFDFETTKDYWGNKKFKHPHIQSRFEGWLLSRKDYLGEKPTSQHTVGYAACLADLYRNNAQDHAEHLAAGTGLTLQDFIDAGVEEYDMQQIRKIYQNLHD